MRFTFVEEPKPYTIRDGRQTDNIIKVCPTCRRRWEKIWCWNAKESIVTYYYDFPQYGKEKEICENC